MNIVTNLLHKECNCVVDLAFLDMIAKCAYFKSEKRGFVPGYELQDWLEAEDEITKEYYYWFQDVD